MVEDLSDPFPAPFRGSFCGFVAQMFEFCEDLLDWIEVGAVGGPEHQSGADRADRCAHGFAFVASKLVEDDDIAWLQGGNETLLHPGEKVVAVHRLIEDEWRSDFVASPGGDEGHGFPLHIGHARLQPFAVRAPSAQPCHIDFGLDLIDEDQLVRIKLAPIFFQNSRLRANVSPVPVGQHNAFLKLRRSA